MKTWTREEIRRVGHLVVDLIADHVAEIETRPVSGPCPTISRNGSCSRRSLQRARRRRGACRIPGIDRAVPVRERPSALLGLGEFAAAMMGVFADALAAAMNPSCAGGNHAAVHVERQVINWFRTMLGFPASSMGLLVSGGSMATLTGLAVARHTRAGIDVREAGLRGAPQPFAFYLSSEAHGCARKAIELLGFGSASIRTIPIDDDYRMRVAALDAAIADDRARGVRPLAVVATAGTTNTGAIDDLDAIADVCRPPRRLDARRRRLRRTRAADARLRERLAGMARADSVAVDPHKCCSFRWRPPRSRPRRRADARGVQPRSAVLAIGGRRRRAALVQRVRDFSRRGDSARSRSG